MGKILVVDDDLGVLRAVIRAAQAEHEVDGAPGGHAGVVMAQSSDYDLILSDVDMPSINGPAMMKKIVEAGRMDRSGFVFMSGAETGACMTLVRDGFRVLKKPFAQEELLQTLRAALLTRKPRVANMAG